MYACSPLPIQAHAVSSSAVVNRFSRSRRYPLRLQKHPPWWYLCNWWIYKGEAHFGCLATGLSDSHAAAGVIGGKIYVFGGCWNRTLDSLDWADVFDPKTQTWDSLPPMPDRDIRQQYTHDSMVVREEKVYAVVGKDITFYYSVNGEEGTLLHRNETQGIGV